MHSLDFVVRPGRLMEVVLEVAVAIDLASEQQCLVDVPCPHPIDILPQREVMMSFGSLLLMSQPFSVAINKILRYCVTRPGSYPLQDGVPLIYTS